MMRTSLGGEMMVVVSLDPGHLDLATLDRVREDLKQLFSAGESSVVHLYTLHMYCAV